MKKAGHRALPSNGAESLVYFFGAVVVSDFIAPAAGVAGVAGTAGVAAIGAVSALVFVAGGLVIAEFDDDDAFCIDFWLAAKCFFFAAFFVPSSNRASSCRRP